LNFLDSSAKNTQISTFTKIHPVRAEMFLVGRRTDRQTWRNSKSLFAILRMCLIMRDNCK